MRHCNQYEMRFQLRCILLDLRIALTWSNLIKPLSIIVNAFCMIFGKMDKLFSY